MNGDRFRGLAASFLAINLIAVSCSPGPEPTMRDGAAASAGDTAPATDTEPGPDTLDLNAALATLARPSAPLILAGSCPGECCTYGDWMTSDSTVVFLQDGDTSVVAFTLPARTEVVAPTGYVRVDSLGLSVVAVDTMRMYSTSGDHPLLHLGDTVLLLGYLGEGYYHAWHDGKVGQFSPLDSDPNAIMLRDVTAEWWVEITTGSGGGWLWMTRTPLLWGADGCGLPGPPPANIEPCASEWIQRVEEVFPVSDSEGHGPDLGSEEWMRSIARRLGVEGAQGNGPDVGSPDWCSAVDRALWGPRD